MTNAVLVAGGAGFIGSHVCKALAAAGYLPVVLDDLSAGRRDFARWGPFYQASVTDGATVAGIASSHGIKAVIDLAGFIEVGESVRDPLKYYDNNSAAKSAFLRAVQAAGIQAFVFSSTAAVYGEPEAVPIVETHPLRPKNPYGWSKLVFEQMLRDFRAAGGPAFIALRYFNAAGASPDAEIGECHEPETHLIPRACLAALGKVPALDVFGADFPTRDGTAERDYVHVADLASAHVLAVSALLGKAQSDAYNLGNGRGTTVREILDTFEMLGCKVPHRYAPRRVGDPAKLIADSSRARAALGWTPVHDDLQVIVKSAYDWQAKLHKA